MPTLYRSDGSPVSVYRADGTLVWGPPPPTAPGPPVVTPPPMEENPPTGYAFMADVAAMPLASGVTVTPEARTAAGTFYKWNTSFLTRLGLVPKDPAAAEVTNLLSGHGSSAFAVEFTFTGDRFWVDAYGGHVNVWVDGARATDWPTPVTGSQSIRVDLGTSATRTILVETGADTRLSGIRAANGDVQATKTPRRRLFVYGDSWIAGAAFHVAPPVGDGTNKRNSPQMRHLGWLTGRYLAGADPYYAGLGGTAYGNTGGSGTNDYAADWRVDQIVKADPHEIVVCGSINSGSNNTEGATAFYRKIEERLPSARIIVIGRQSYGDGTNSGGVDADIKAAADAAPNVLGYVSPRAEKWITGIGDTLSGTGQAALYHNGENRNHLSDAGNLYYAEMTAKAVARLLPAA